jgi:hypothetical protein
MCYARAIATTKTSYRRRFGDAASQMEGTSIDLQFSRCRKQLATERDKKKIWRGGGSDGRMILTLIVFSPWP